MRQVELASYRPRKAIGIISAVKHYGRTSIKDYKR